MAADDHLTNGTNITPAIWNAVMDELKALRQNAYTSGGTVGATTLPPKIDSDRRTVTTDSSGNAFVPFNFTFDEAPGCTVTGWGQNPNVLMTIATSGTDISTTGVRVHCHDVKNDANFGNKSVIVTYIAAAKN